MSRVPQSTSLLKVTRTARTPFRRQLSRHVFHEATPCSPVSASSSSSAGSRSTAVEQSLPRALHRRTRAILQRVRECLIPRRTQRPRKRVNLVPMATDVDNPGSVRLARRVDRRIPPLPGSSSSCTHAPTSASATPHRRHGASAISIRSCRSLGARCRSCERWSYRCRIDRPSSCANPCQPSPPRDLRAAQSV